MNEKGVYLCNNNKLIYKTMNKQEKEFLRTKIETVQSKLQLAKINLKMYEDVSCGLRDGFTEILELEVACYTNMLIEFKQLLEVNSSIIQADSKNYINTDEGY